jgi:hypothetical protein
VDTRRCALAFCESAAGALLGPPRTRPPWIPAAAPPRTVVASAASRVLELRGGRHPRQPPECRSASAPAAQCQTESGSCVSARVMRPRCTREVAAGIHRRAGRAAGRTVLPAACGGRWDRGCPPLRSSSTRDAPNATTVRARSSGGHPWARRPWLVVPCFSPAAASTCGGRGDSLQSPSATPSRRGSTPAARRTPSAP